MTDIINEQEQINNIEPKKNKEDSVESICKLSNMDLKLQFLFKLLKMFGIKTLITLIMKRKLIFSGQFSLLLKNILSASNLRFSVGLSLLSFIYKVLIKILSSLNKYMSLNDTVIKIISIFIASFTSINFFDENASRFYILILTTRVGANFISEIFKKYNLFQGNSKINDYLLFAFATSVWTLGMFLNPGYKFIPNNVAQYALYTPSEKREFDDLMQKTKLV